MYMKCIKSLALLLLVWILAMSILVTNYELNKNFNISPMEEYEEKLKTFDNKVVHPKGSEFNAWRRMKPVYLEEIHDTKFKYTAIDGTEFPPGMDGKPVHLVSDLKNPLRSLVEKGWEDYAFNEFVSELIPINRTLFDPRDEWCKKQIYSNKLPQVSVVICFHNEAWSTLLRTVHSILEKSPENLLKEIILVDDYSNLPHLKDRLDNYVHHLPKVTLVRINKREGLIRARLIALKYTTAPVILYLDSHCECAEGWLEPLLDRIAQDPTIVVSPIVDVIHSKSFEYVAQQSNDLRIGGFTWDLHFTWESIPREVLVKRNNSAAPIKTPTISGGLFAIDKDFFRKLGYYDDGFEIWGSENLELSFKTWMCGGSLEIVPCSHVGHVFRKRFPYKKPLEAPKRNAVRLAEVWMDDYAKYFYERIGNDKGDFGDISDRINLRKQMKCKSFEWYLKNIYPELEVPSNYVASGKIYGLSGDLLCLDSPADPYHYFEGVKLFPCHFKGGNQFWVYTKDGEIKRDSFCLEDISEFVFLNICRGRQKSQVWVYNQNTKTITNMASLKCLYAIKNMNQWSIRTVPCTKAHRQTWGMENFKIERLLPELQVFAKREV